MIQTIIPIHIGIIKYAGVQQVAVLGLIELFSVANRIVRKESRVEKSISQIHAVQIEQPIVNLDLPTFIVEGSRQDFSALVLPPMEDGLPVQNVHKTYIHNIQHYHKQGILISSVGNGVFILAESGVIDQKTVSIHWQYHAEFTRQFPHIDVNVNSLIHEDRNIITAAGMMTWMDLGLRLVKHFMGPVIMGKIANYLLLQPSGREQSYFSVFTPSYTHGDSAILKGQEWIERQGNMDVSLHQLADVTGLEIRTLQRRFVKATRMTITEYTQRYRIHKAQEYLQFTKLPVDEISTRTGYKDSNTFRKVFIKITGLSPNLYRRNFAI